MSELSLGAMVAKAEEVAKEMDALGAEYLYDDVYVYHDGWMYWLCTSQGGRIALEHRTLQMFMDFVKRREAQQ